MQCHWNALKHLKREHWTNTSVLNGVEMGWTDESGFALETSGTWGCRNIYNVLPVLVLDTQTERGIRNTCSRITQRIEESSKFLWKKRVKSRESNQTWIFDSKQNIMLGNLQSRISCSVENDGDFRLELHNTGEKLTLRCFAFLRLYTAKWIYMNIHLNILYNTQLRLSRNSDFNAQ